MRIRHPFTQSQVGRFIAPFCGLIALAIAVAAVAEPPQADGSPGLSNAVILIIRHAEKPDSGPGLSPMGERRAAAYVDYFARNFLIDAKPLHLDCLFAAADSKESVRPRLTLGPLGRNLGLAIDTRFKNKEFKELANELRSKGHGSCILICWHHGEIPNLVGALGGDPGKLLPDGEWPGHVFGWVLQLRYDQDGHLIGHETKRIEEHLMPDDTGK
jgi:hypothetical protein